MFTPSFRDKQQIKPTLRDLQSKAGSNLMPAPIPAFSAEPVHNPQACVGATLLDMSPSHVETAPPPPEVTLADVFVPLESIQPSKRARCLPAPWSRSASKPKPPSSLPAGSLLPVTVFDGHSLRVLFHFARDSPPYRPDVLVVIISMLSSAPVPVTGISFRVTAPKVSIECLDLTPARAWKLNCPSVLCFGTTTEHGGEAPATIRNRAPGLQPHPSPCCCHTGPAAGKPKQGEPRSVHLNTQFVPQDQILFMFRCIYIFFICANAKQNNFL